MIQRDVPVLIKQQAEGVIGHHRLVDHQLPDFLSSKPGYTNNFLRIELHVQRVDFNQFRGVD